jgi:hypothetical protein
MSYMSKDEAWAECKYALESVCQDRCYITNCGCDAEIEKIRVALYV